MIRKVTSIAKKKAELLCRLQLFAKFAFCYFVFSTISGKLFSDSNHALSGDDSIQPKEFTLEIITVR